MPFYNDYEDPIGKPDFLEDETGTSYELPVLPN